MSNRAPLNLKYVLGGASLLALSSHLPAIAQDSSADGATEVADTETTEENSLKLGSITVTAQRREESANDVPMSIQAFDGEQLEVLRVTSVDDLQSLVPSFSVSQSYQGVPTYTLRGIGFNTINLSATSTVGTYVDEVAYPYPIMNAGPVFDVDRVEVLKGPQGTLFGRNTTAGLINLVTSKPADEFAAQISGELGNYDTWNFGGMLNLPLSDTAQARFAFRNEHSDEGWQKSNTRGEDRGTKDRLGLRAALSLQPTEQFEVDLSYNGWVNKSDTIAAQAIGFTPNTGPGGGFFPFNAPGLTQYIADNQPTDASQADWVDTLSRSTDIGIGLGVDGPHEEDSTFHGVKVRLGYEFSNGINLISLTGYNQLEREAVTDYGGAPYEILAQDISGEIESISQEIRFEGETGPANWTVGAYYGRDEIVDSNVTLLGENANVPGIRAFILGLDLLNSPINTTLPQPYTLTDVLQTFRSFADRADFETETASIFASADWEISDQLSLTTGIRYTEDSQDYNGCSRDNEGSFLPNINLFNRTFYAGLYGGGTPPDPISINECVTYHTDLNEFGPVISNLSENNVAWRVVANWTPSEEILLFGSVSRGAKSASTPVNAANIADQNAPATQEFLTAYEVGVKANLFSNRTQANASVFYYDYEDKQVSGFFPDPVYTALSRLQNVPESRAYGLDVDVTALVAEGITVVAAGTWLDTEITDYVGINGAGLPQDFDGASFLYSPEFTGSLSLMYDKPLHSTLGLRGALNARYQSDSQAGLSGNPLYAIDGHTSLNGTIGIYSLDGPWELSLWGQNLTDEYHWGQVTSNANTIVRFAAQPRTYGLSLTYTY